MVVPSVTETVCHVVVRIAVYSYPALPPAAVVSTPPVSRVALICYCKSFNACVPISLPPVLSTLTMLSAAVHRASPFLGSSFPSVSRPLPVPLAVILFLLS